MKCSVNVLGYTVNTPTWISQLCLSLPFLLTALRSAKVRLSIFSVLFSDMHPTLHMNVALWTPRNILRAFPNPLQTCHSSAFPFVFFFFFVSLFLAPSGITASRQLLYWSAAVFNKQAEDRALQRLSRLRSNQDKLWEQSFSGRQRTHRIVTIPWGGLFEEPEAPSRGY